jgi:hypothetical protein
LIRRAAPSATINPSGAVCVTPQPPHVRVDFPVQSVFPFESQFETIHHDPEPATRLIYLVHYPKMSGWLRHRVLAHIFCIIPDFSGQQAKSRSSFHPELIAHTF